MENETLILDLLEWIGAEPKPYDEVMSAWRTSCPRLPVWEDTVDASFVKVKDQMVSITREGREFLKKNR